MASAFDTIASIASSSLMQVSPSLQGKAAAAAACRSGVESFDCEEDWRAS